MYRACVPCGVQCVRNKRGVCDVCIVHDVGVVCGVCGVYVVCDGGGTVEEMEQSSGDETLTTGSRGTGAPHEPSSNKHFTTGVLVATDWH